MNIWALCSCSGSQICQFCKMLVIVCLILAGGGIGYLIGKRKKGSNGEGKTH